MFRSLSLFLVLGLVSAAVAEDTSPLAKLDADRASLKSLTIVADIQTPKSNDRWATFPMFFDYCAPNKYRSEIKTGGFEGDLIGVADGEFIWSYSTKKKEVTKVPQVDAIKAITDKGPNDLLTVLATPSLTFGSLFNVVSSVKNDSGMLVEIMPKTAVSSYEKIKILISEDGKTPLSAEAWKRNKIVARMIFKTYTRNSEVDSEKFTFTVPENVRLKTN